MRVCFLAVLALSCGLPTAPSSGHPKEVEVEAYTQCHAAYAGIGRVDVRFTDSMIPGASPGFTRKAITKGREVTYWGPWVRGEVVTQTPNDSITLELLAAHEVGHIRGTRSEAEANAWAVAAVAAAGCGR